MFPATARAIVFDVVGTLVEPAPAVAEAYRAAALRHGIDHDVADIGGRFRTAWRRQEALDAAALPPFATSGDRERERWRAIVADVFDAAPQSDAIFTDLWAHFGRPDAWRAIPAGRDLVRAARDAGLTVALASNFDERLFGIATVIEPLSWADHVFASSELGWRKPAVEFFRTVERRLGRSPEELVLVGDDAELDIAAGRHAGWHVLPIS
jgi:putative hydrolase of the HAD superfamily